MHETIHRFERLPLVGKAPVSACEMAAPPVRVKPLVGLIRNARSHRNGGKKSAANAYLPSTLRADVLSYSPDRRGELLEILAELAQRQVDYIAIDGGDGTVRDVLTCGAGIFGECWPSLIILPSGKTNALALDLGIPDNWTLEQALEIAKNQTVKVRRPLVVSQRGNEEAQATGFVMGGGAYASAIALGQKAHSLGAFNAAVVGLTAAWSTLQAFFGGSKNPWRRGTAMRLTDSSGRDLPHCGNSPADQRYVMLASTLERFPAGVNPFGKVAVAGLRVAVLDNAKRRLLLHVPAIITGKGGEAAKRQGYHSFSMERVGLDIGDRFILDGEEFPAGQYCMTSGPKLRFVAP